MARRRRRPRGSNSGVQLIQIVGLGLVLVMILLFRDEIAGGAGNFFGGFGSEDVQLPEERTAPADPTTTVDSVDAGSKKPSKDNSVDAGP